MKLKNVLIVYSKLAEAEKIALASAGRALEKLNIDYKRVSRNKLSEASFKNKDLILTIGGDGTLLRAAQFIKDKTPILGINSNPKQKEGFFLKATIGDIENRIKRIIKNKFKIINIARLEASINGRKINEPALNEFYAGHKKPYKISRYTLKISDKKEAQKSSGIIAGTSFGFRGWLLQAGGKELANNKKFQFVVREPYKGRLTKPKLLKGVLNKNEKIEIAKLKGILVADSVSREYSVDIKDRVIIKMSDKPLRMVVF